MLSPEHIPEHLGWDPGIIMVLSQLEKQNKDN